MFKKSIVRYACLGTLVGITVSCSQQHCDYEELRVTNMNQELQYLKDEPIEQKCLTLDEIIQITLERNLDLMVKQQEVAIQMEIATGAKLKMLPALRLNSNVYTRNNNTGSSSQSLVPGIPPAPPSISQDASYHREDENLVINLLDFGLSYFRSRQEENRTLMLEMEYERARQNLILDVTKAYWKAVANKRAYDKSAAIIAKSDKQKSNVTKQMEAKIIPEIQGFRSQNQLLTINLELQAFERDYHTSMTELALHMGIPPCSEFEIVDPLTLCTDIATFDICELEEYALLNRPELFGKDVEERVWADEARMAIVQMLPGIELFAGNYDDSNSFLIFKQWLAAGIRATWNLLALPQLTMQYKAAEDRMDLSYMNRLAISIGVMTQVHLAYLVYLDNRTQFLMAYELQKVNEGMLAAARKEASAGKLHEADILRYEAETLLSEVYALKSYADMQNALEQLNNAIGMPRFYQTISGPPSFDKTIPVRPCSATLPVVKNPPVATPVPRQNLAKQANPPVEHFVESQWLWQPQQNNFPQQMKTDAYGNPIPDRNWFNQSDRSSEGHASFSLTDTYENPLYNETQWEPQIHDQSNFMNIDSFRNQPY